MQIAVLDIGTNTTRLLIAEADGTTVTEEHVRISRVTRLGAGVDASGRLAPEALAREYEVLERYRELIEASAEKRGPVERTVAVMTSAVRDAGNGDQFAEAVKDDFGIEPHILSGDREAQLTYLGATDSFQTSPEDGPTLIIDIGGGSTEFVIGNGDQIDFHVSTQAGVVRQADRHISHDPPTDAELLAVASDVRATITAAVPPERRRGIGRAIAVAGTPTQLAAIAQHLDPYDPELVHGYRLTAGERDRILARVVRLPLAERQQKIVGLHPERANVLIPGIVILKEVMDLFQLDGVEVSEHDILRGAAIYYSGA
jgi:exopolyphosphatase / guanosine-5'-triphosphate,3'-diphosphate pyrophosphatase